MRIVFMGTPDFAVPCLQAVLDAGHTVCGVFTQPDKPKGRSYKMTPPPVKTLAEKYGLPVFQPKSLRTPEVLTQLQQLAPDVAVVVAYGKILPKSVLDVPAKGCINVHASLLPAYRGAAPIQWAVLNGDKETGVTTMYMAEGLDTGDILLQKKTAIGPDETAGELHDRLSVLGASLLVETLAKLDTLTPRPQGEPTTPYASMLDKSMCPIDWTRPAQEIHNQIRGLSPWPVATTTFSGKPLKIHASVLAEPKNGVPGSVHEGFVVTCGNNTAIKLCRVQPAGKRPMDGEAFLRGHAVKDAILPF